MKTYTKMLYPAVNRQPRHQVRCACSQFNEQNRQAEEVILSDIAKYGGEQAALVQWARTVLGPVDSEAEPLFAHGGKLKPCAEIDFDHPEARVRD